MRILHTSDLHGDIDHVLRHHADTDFDVWVDTGDFFPNAGRVPCRHGRMRIDPRLERPYQQAWFKANDLGQRICSWLGGRPAVVVGGNHDFIDLAPLLPLCYVHEIDPYATITLGGLRWGGFRNINTIAGEWVGETHSDILRSLVSTVMDQHPDVLVTHAPPQGVLDEIHGYGLVALRIHLDYGTLTHHTHLFGHCHADGGNTWRVHGVSHHNSARIGRVLDIPDEPREPLVRD